MLARLTSVATVAAVVTQPDRPSGRGKKLQPTPVNVAALERGLTVLAPEKLRPFAADVAALGIERCVVASYGRIIPQALLDAVPLWFNVHPSLLPLYRGATPIQSAIRDGRASTALSIIAMDAGMDTGDLLVQSADVPIGERETYGELHDRLAVLGAGALASALGDDARGTLRRVPQSQRARELGITDAEVAATLTRPWTATDERIDLRQSAQRVVDSIRALAPRPAALVEESVAGPFRVVAAHICDAAPFARDGAPGMVAAECGALYLRAADRWLAVDEVVFPGKNRMPMAAWANGHRAVNLIP